MKENTAVNVKMTRLLLRFPQKVITNKSKSESLLFQGITLFQLMSFFSAPRLVKLTNKLNNVAAMEGKDAIFKCGVTPADVNVKWFHNNTPITAGPKYRIEHGGSSHLLTIISVTQKDAGEISIDAEGKSCKAILQVQRKNLCLFAKYQLYYV